MVRAAVKGVFTLIMLVPAVLVSVPPSQTLLPFNVQPPLAKVMVLVIAV